MLATSIISSGLIANAAHKGGQIRHDEIRDAKSAGSTEKSGPAMTSEQDEDEHAE